MLKCFRKMTSCIPQWWIDFTLNRSRSLLILALLLSVGVFFYTVSNFKINTNLTEMVSDKLPFRKDIKEYRQAFPQLADTIVVVIDAETPELAIQSRKLLADRLLAERGKFQSLFLPGGGDFFEKNGLLYLSIDELETLTDNLAEIQPFLGLLSQDLSLQNFFDIFGQVVDESGETISDNPRFLLLFDRLSEAVDHSLAGRPYPFSWQEIMLGKDAERTKTRQFIVIQPLLDYTTLAPGKQAINTIRDIAKELGLNSENGVQVRITGSVALKNSDFASVSSGIELAALISFVLVAGVLYIGLRSVRMVIMSLATLTVAIVWTMGFAIAFIGSLNMISIAFVVLFIGLGVDYSIQLCLRYAELLTAGFEKRSAVAEAAKEVGNALFLCTATTAIGFYAFVPTAYTGASELGIIAGSGMFIVFFANISVLPSLLNLFPVEKVSIKASTAGQAATTFINKYHRAIIICTAMLAVAATFLSTKVKFDFNPLNLSNPSAEPVIAAKELFADSKTSPWTIAVLAGSLEQAQELTDRLKKVPEVDSAINIASFIPGNQQEKLDMIEDIALFMPTGLRDIHIAPLHPSAAMAAIERFADTLQQSPLLPPGAGGTPVLAAKRLHDNLLRLIRDGGVPQGTLSTLQLLEKETVANLAITLNDLYSLLNLPYEFGLDDLPVDLKSRFVSENGRYLVQVFPKKNINNLEALTSFVTSVKAIAPNATSNPVTILESGKAIVSAFRNALFIALASIVIFLAVTLRNPRDIVLMITPLLLALLFTVATTVGAGIPFNFANIIVLPLLLGIGVDYGIHLILRYRVNSITNDNLLQTSTARAVFFSALTTILSFSSLIFSSHQGMASMGILLSICNGIMIVCTLIILPAILKQLQTKKITENR